MNSVPPPTGLIHLGLDTSKNAIAVGILRPEDVSPDVEKIFNDEASIRRLIDRFADRGVLRVCYEAGPTGLGLYRLLTSMGVACQVVAPSLVPRRAGDRVKTDRRDCRRLARLHRAGELTAIRLEQAIDRLYDSPARSRRCRARSRWVHVGCAAPAPVVAAERHAPSPPSSA